MNFNMIYTLNRFIIRLIIVHRSVQSSIGSTRLVIKLLSLMTLHSALVKRELLIVSMVSTTMNPNHIPIKKCTCKDQKPISVLLGSSFTLNIALNNQFHQGRRKITYEKSGKIAYLSYENQ